MRAYRKVPPRATQHTTLALVGHDESVCVRILRSNTAPRATTLALVGHDESVRKSRSNSLNTTHTTLALVGHDESVRVCVSRG